MRSWRRLRRPDERGQALMEFALVLPLLLLLLCGVIELGRIYETHHIMSSLTREGANLASRGATMPDALSVTRANQMATGLGSGGGAIVSRVLVDGGGVPRVESQVATSGYSAASRVASPNAIATPYQEAGLRVGHRYYVVELFVPYTPITPLPQFMTGIFANELYDRTLF